MAAATAAARTPTRSIWVRGGETGGISPLAMRATSHAAARDAFAKECAIRTPRPHLPNSVPPNRMGIVIITRMPSPTPLLSLHTPLASRTPASTVTPGPVGRDGRTPDPPWIVPRRATVKEGRVRDLAGITPDGRITRTR